MSTLFLTPTSPSHFLHVYCILLAWIAFGISTLNCQTTTPPNADPFPTPPDKKGLQVQMVDDALSLGVHHAALNVSLGALWDDTPRATSWPVSSGGHQYFINGPYAQQLTVQIKTLSDGGTLVYLILLAYPSHVPTKDALLLHPKSNAETGYTIGAFNTASAEGLDLYRALVGFLAERHSGAHPDLGRVWGYIVGNEVNSQWLWYHLGRQSLAETVSDYEKAVRATHEAVRQHSTHARCYISLDHHWSASMPGIGKSDAYPGRDLLDAFAAVARARGDFEWHVAHHPYPDDLGNPRNWLDKDAPPTDDAPHVTFKNLPVLCKHLERPALLWQGLPRRVILSEQGLHCLATPDGENLQAAGFAYVWEQVARCPGIDALIWHRHVDHSQEGGLRLGLWENKPGTISEPGRKRRLYDMFQKAATPEWTTAAKWALPIVGLESWDELAQ